MRWLIGLTVLGHVLAAILAGALLIAGIFFVHGVAGWLLLGAALLMVLVAVALRELRLYRERSGPAFPGDPGYRGR